MALISDCWRPFVSERHTILSFCALLGTRMPPPICGHWSLRIWRWCIMDQQRLGLKNLTEIDTNSKTARAQARCFKLQNHLAEKCTGWMGSQSRLVHCCWDCCWDCCWVRRTMWDLPSSVVHSNHLKLLKSTGSPQFTSCFQTGSLICVMHQGSYDHKSKALYLYISLSHSLSLSVDDRCQQTRRMTQLAEQTSQPCDAQTFSWLKWFSCCHPPRDLPTVWITP